MAISAGTRLGSYEIISPLGAGGMGEVYRARDTRLERTDGKSRLFLKANASLRNAQFSPDGKWIAYASNESGRWEAYVTSFPDARGKWQVSANGGEQPRWRGDGKEIYFLSPDAKLMAASIDTKAEFESGTPTVLFQTDPRERVATTESIVYDVSRDGQRFLINTNYTCDQSSGSVSTPRVTTVARRR